MIDNLNKLLLAFITIIIGVVFLVQIATSTVAVTGTTTETETIDISAARLAGNNINETYQIIPTRVAESLSGWRSTTSGCQESDLLGDAVFTNASGDALTITTDYVIGTGYFTLVNSTTVHYSTNQTLVTIDYCDDNYVSGWGGNIMNLVPGFIALALMAIGIALFYSVYRDMRLA